MDYKIYAGNTLTTDGERGEFSGSGINVCLYNINVILKTLIEAYKYKLGFRDSDVDLKQTSTQLVLKVAMPNEGSGFQLKIPTYRIDENLLEGNGNTHKLRKLENSDFKPNINTDGKKNESIIEGTSKKTIEIVQITYQDNDTVLDNEMIGNLAQNQDYYKTCNDNNLIKHSYTFESNTSYGGKFFKKNNVYHYTADEGNVLINDEDSKREIHTIAALASNLIYNPSTQIQHLNLNIDDNGILKGGESRFDQPWSLDDDNNMWRLLGLYQDDPDAPFIMEKIDDKSRGKCLEGKNRLKRLNYRVAVWYKLHLEGDEMNGTLMIAHRGSATWRDWGHDDMMISLGMGQMNSRIHDFYWNILPEIVEDLQLKIKSVITLLQSDIENPKWYKEVGKEKNIDINAYVTGHSLGGYLALSTAKRSIYDARPGQTDTNQSLTWANSRGNTISLSREFKTVLRYNNYIYPIVMNPFLGSINKDKQEFSNGTNFGKIFDDFLNSIPMGDLYHVYNPFEVSSLRPATWANWGFDNASERLDVFLPKHEKLTGEDKPKYANNNLIFHNTHNVLHSFGPDYGGVSLVGAMAWAHGVHQFYGYDNHKYIAPIFNPANDTNEYIIYNGTQNLQVNETGLQPFPKLVSWFGSGSKKTRRRKSNAKKSNAGKTRHRKTVIKSMRKKRTLKKNKQNKKTKQNKKKLTRRK